MLLALAVAAACIRLGFWQLSRLEQQRALNQEIRAGLEAEAVGLNDVSASAIEPYHRAEARGRLDAAHQVVLTARTYENQSGAHLVTPLLLEGREAAVLVDRGWIPFAERDFAGLEQYQVEGLISVEGVVKTSQSQVSLPLLPTPASGSLEDPRPSWPALDVPAIQAQVPYELLPFYLALTEPAPRTGAAPIPNPDLELSEGPHLGYAIQWFAFALIALAGGGYWTWRQMRE